MGGRLESNTVSGPVRVGLGRDGMRRLDGIQGGYPVTDSGMDRGVVDQPSYPSTRWLGHSLKGTGDVDSTESACG